MDNINLVLHTIAKLKKEKIRLETKLKTRKADVGGEDGPNQSRYISLSRFALEEELVMLEKLIKRIGNEIFDLEKEKNTVTVVTVIWQEKEKKLLLTKSVEDFNNGIISEDSPVGKILKNSPTKKLVINTETITSELKKLSDKI